MLGSFFFQNANFPQKLDELPSADIENNNGVKYCLRERLIGDRNPYTDISRQHASNNNRIMSLFSNRFPNFDNMTFVGGGLCNSN